MPTISVHVNEDLFRELGVLAEQLERSKSWVVTDALRPYLGHRRWIIAEAEKARDDLATGTVQPVSHDDAVSAITSFAESLDA